MKQDVFHARKVPFEYISPAVCDFIFSASGKTEIFLTNKAATGIIGLTHSYDGNTIRLQWDTYPGALCYSVYKLVDELDPYSTWRLIAECITDNFLDVTDPGAYAVTPVTPEGEGTIPDPYIVPPPTPGPGACSGNQPPVGIGIEEDVCENTAKDIDVSSANTDPEGQPLTITAATADVGSVAWAGLVITYTPPTDYYGDALISYTVADPCEAEASNAILIHVWDTPEFTVPDLTTCDDSDLVIDVTDHLTTNDVQDWTVTDASVDTGGSVAFVDSTVTFTPTPAFSGSVVLSYTVMGSCGEEFASTANIEVACGCDAWFGSMAWSEYTVPDPAQCTCTIVPSTGKIFTMEMHGIWPFPDPGSISNPQYEIRSANFTADGTSSFRIYLSGTQDWISGSPALGGVDSYIYNADDTYYDSIYLSPTSKGAFSSLRGPWTLPAGDYYIRFILFNISSFVGHDVVLNVEMCWTP